MQGVVIHSVKLKCGDRGIALHTVRCCPDAVFIPFSSVQSRDDPSSLQASVASKWTGQRAALHLEVGKQGRPFQRACRRSEPWCALKAPGPPRETVAQRQRVRALSPSPRVRWRVVRSQGGETTVIALAPIRSDTNTRKKNGSLLC